MIIPRSFFQMVQMSLGYRNSLDSLMLTPVQRITRYQLLLREITKSLDKAGDQERLKLVQEAFEVANRVCNHANDMMIAGRIQGFPVSPIEIKTCDFNQL